jgi:hypothetical protein
VLVLPSSAGAACVGDTVVVGNNLFFNLAVEGRRTVGMLGLGIRESHFACVPRTPTPTPLLIIIR